jgi:hypothetical protein
MKQITLTPELEARIKKAVGDDVDTSGFAVFEAIALNTQPLPGKRGTIFERAEVTLLTLRQMSDYIQTSGVPLVTDHEMYGSPKGRVFAADVFSAEDGHYELRALFYLDPTEETIITKLNSASLDEVSVSFKSTQLLCSECGWDYFGEEANWQNLYERTCGNAHTIGADGVHTRMVGLDQFLELSLVARGAAKSPKVIGKSASKLQPATAMRLAARGFELDALVFQGGAGEEVVNFDPNKLVADLATSQAQVITLTAGKTAADTQVTTLTADLATANDELATLRGEVTQLTADLTAARAAPSNQADYDEAIAFLGETLNKVLVASGAEALADDKLPKTVAELKTAIVDKTNGLTAILPIGGVAATDKDDNTTLKAGLIPSAFSNRAL